MRGANKEESDDNDPMWMYQQERGRARGHRYNLPQEAKALLAKWLHAHQDDPYPTDNQKVMASDFLS